MTRPTKRAKRPDKLAGLISSALAAERKEAFDAPAKPLSKRRMRLIMSNEAKKHAPAQNGVTRYWINAQLDTGGIRILPEAIADGEWVKHADHLADVARVAEELGRCQVESLRWKQLYFGLRETLRKCARAAGGDASEVASDEFLSRVPGEIECRLSAAIREREALREERDKLLHSCESMRGEIKRRGEVIREGTLERAGLENERDEARAHFLEALYATPAGDGSPVERVKALVDGSAKLRAEAARLREVVDATLTEIPVGYIPAHTAENLPAMVAGLVERYAEESKELDKAEADLATLRQQLDAAGSGEVTDAQVEAACVEWCRQINRKYPATLDHHRPMQPDEVMRRMMRAALSAALPKPSPATADPMVALLREALERLVFWRTVAQEEEYGHRQTSEVIARIEAALPKTNEGAQS